MTAIAIYSAKGGVGKTTLAVGLSWASAVRSSRRTLLWDLDAQGASTFVLARSTAKAQAREVIERDVDPQRAITPTTITGLEILAADPSIRELDFLFAQMDRKKRLLRVLDDLSSQYDRVLLDCPPGLGATADQVLRAARLIVVPMIPSTLSRRSYEAVCDHLAQGHKGRPKILPVFNMVDRRRAAHRAAIEAQPDWPVIPMASAAERMGDERAPIGAYAPRSPVAKAIAELWVRVERALA